MIDKIDFKAKNLTSNTGLFLLLENVKSNGIFDLFENDLVFDQECDSKGYNPKKRGNRCYNIQFAFCDELKAYVTWFVGSDNTYTANGAAEMIKEIIATIKTNELEIFFRMDSCYFDEEIIETIESLGCNYLIKAKAYTTLVSQLTNSSTKFVKGEEGRETSELFLKPNKWEKSRRFVVSRVLKPEKERTQLCLLECSEYE